MTISTQSPQRYAEGRRENESTDYSATPTCLIDPFGPGLCFAHRSSSVIGTVMQNVPGAQGPQGELTELSVTGGQLVAAAAVDLLALFA